MQLAQEREINESLKKQIEELTAKIQSITSHNDSITEKTIETLEKEKNLKQEVGESTYEVVKKNFFILKEMTKIDESQISEFVQNYETLRKNKHPNVIDIEGIFMNEEKKSVKFLFEKCSCNLNQAIKSEKLNKIDLSFIIYQIAEGMKFIHSKRIIHTNLKPSNILIGFDGLIKISDIALNNIRLTDNKQIPISGDTSSLNFIAPEFLNNMDCNEKIDVYSFGIIVYFIVSNGNLPDCSLNDLININAIPFEVPSDFLPNTKDIIESCCYPNPDTRPSFDEIVEFLKNENCMLLDLKQSESDEVHNRISEHQKIIPVFED